jgi:hypothetical protein
VLQGAGKKTGSGEAVVYRFDFWCGYSGRQDPIKSEVGIPVSGVKNS